jgi:peptide/nickel transport system substrate-binding protein
MVKPPRRTRSAMTAVVISVLLVAGAIVVPGSLTGWAAGPTTFIWGKSGDAGTLDAPVDTNGETYEVITQIFDLLVRAQPGKTDIEADLATSWSVSPDGLTWTFKLRQGVTFHDGTPWNAEAAKFNFDRWADAKNPYHTVGSGFDYEYWADFMADSFQEAKAVDPYTLQVVLKKANAPFIYNLSIASFAFTSPAAIKQYGAQGIGQHPVGTGPYKFVEWVRDDHVTMTANPTFFRKGLPKMSRLIMRVIKDNAARFLALKADEVQAMEAPNPDDVKAAQADPNLKLGFRPPFNTGWVRFNMHNDYFKDKRIRQAVAMAINRKAIVDGLYGLYGTVATQHMPPLMWGRANVKGYDYNPDMAKKLLAEAGYPNGFGFDFWYIPVSRPYFPNGKDIGTAIASDLGKVGLRANVQTEDWATYLKDRNTNKFPIFMIGWIGDNGDPDDWLGFFFPRHDPANAYLSYDNPAVFDAINKAKVATSKSERAKLYAQAETMVINDYRDVPIAHARVPLLMRKNVQNLIGQPDANEYMELVELR